MKDTRLQAFTRYMLQARDDELLRQWRMAKFAREARVGIPVDRVRRAAMRDHPSAIALALYRALERRAEI